MSYELNGYLIDYDCRDRSYNGCHNAGTHTDQTMSIYLADGIRPNSKYVYLCQAQVDAGVKWGWKNIRPISPTYDLMSCIRCSKKISQPEAIQFNSRCIDCTLS